MHFRLASLKPLDALATLHSVLLLVASLAVLPHAIAQAELKTLTWDPSGSPYKMSGYDCVKEGVGTIFITGTIELVHPDDTMAGDAPELVIICNNFIFVKNSKVVSTASLYFRAEANISGNVTIENLRGTPGAKGYADESIYKRRRAATGTPGNRGKPGDGAIFSSIDYPNGRNAENGGEGGPGGRGTDGTSVDKASTGRLGAPAARTTLKARNYGAGTSIIIIAKGGRGGDGADGGTGIDGGNGGPGGIGGRGGNADTGRTAGDGGRGGRGGDGGNGGQGGPGGDGGMGGRGGDAQVIIISDENGKHGNPPADWTHYLDGGEGGKPGIGGAPGRYGLGVPGAFGGCGGSGTNFLNILKHPDGACGGQGDHGVDGLDGQPGSIGSWGEDGKPGNPGDWRIFFAVEKGGH